MLSKGIKFMPENIKITWLGHACFTIEADSYKILIDPYKNGYVPGFELNTQYVNEVLCSHEHADHNFREAAKLLPNTKNPFRITGISTYHDNKNGSLRGKNTIYILEAHGMKIIHFGDIGCDITEEQAQMPKGADAVMIPVGGFYTITAQEANDIVCKISPKIVIPMHYRTGDYGFRELGDISEFTRLRDDVVYGTGNTVEITKNSLPGCIVPKYIPETDSDGKVR